MGIKEEKPKDIPPQFTSILDKYQDVFPSNLPKVLPPVRQLGHNIPLIEGAKPTFWPLYHLSPKERNEVHKLVPELLRTALVVSNMFMTTFSLVLLRTALVVSVNFEVPLRSMHDWLAQFNNVLYLLYQSIPIITSNYWLKWVTLNVWFVWNPPNDKCMLKS